MLKIYVWTIWSNLQCCYAFVPNCIRNHHTEDNWKMANIMNQKKAKYYYF